MPTYAFIASIATAGDHQSEQDDPSVRELDLETFASPQVTDVSLRMDDQWVEHLKALAAVEVEFAEPVDLRWEDSGWTVEVSPSRSHQVFRGYDDEGELAVAIVVQQVGVFQ